MYTVTNTALGYNLKYFFDAKEKCKLILSRREKIKEDFDYIPLDKLVSQNKSIEQELRYFEEVHSTICNYHNWPDNEFDTGSQSIQKLVEEYQWVITAHIGNVYPLVHLPHLGRVESYGIEDGFSIGFGMIGTPQNAMTKNYDETIEENLCFFNDIGIMKYQHTEPIRMFDATYIITTFPSFDKLLTVTLNYHKNEKALEFHNKKKKELALLNF
ncbi:hypothetical protein J4228_00060 [Candidatus Woesearchaeota archaeon]|nr:hypothetical protein [Candidatus Woesearchaeota archaeon]